MTDRSPAALAGPLQPADRPTSPVTVVTLWRGEPLAWDERLGSLAAQTLQGWRWVVAHPPSVEPPPALAEDGRVARLTWDGRGPGAALEALDSPLVCVLDGQARLAPTFLEKAAWLLATNPRAGFCGAHPAPINGDGPPWPYGFEQGPGFLENNFAGAAFVIRRELLAPADLAALAGAAPHALWRFWLTLASRGHWGLTIPEPLVRYPFNGAVPAFWTGDGDDPETARLRYTLRREHASLLLAFPPSGKEEPEPYLDVPDAPPFENSIPKPTGTRRLLVLMPWLIIGGAERVNLDLIRQLASLGYEVTVATTLCGVSHPWLGEFMRHTPDVFVLDHLLRLNDFPRFLRYLIRSRAIDTVMISNSYLSYQLLPYLRAHCPSVTFVDYVHSYEEAWRGGGYPRCGVAYQEQLDLNIAASDHVRQWMVRRGGRPERIELSYTNVDVERWRRDEAARARVRAELGLGEEQTLIVFVARLSHEKRPELVARIIGRLRREGVAGFLCLVLGDGPERSNLERAVAEEGVGETLRLLGRVGDAELGAYLSAADVMLLVSQYEGVSVATFEAMAMGLVPVVSRVGGQAELVTPDCGLLVPLGEGELEQYVGALAGLIGDPGRRRALGAAARERVARHFPLSSFGPRMSELFERARTLHLAEPRLAVGTGLARELAAQAVEHTRVEQVVDLLWARQQSSTAGPAAPAVPSALHSAAARARDTLRPVYHAAVRGGMTWLVPLKDRLRAAVRQRSGGR